MKESFQKGKHYSILSAYTIDNYIAWEVYEGGGEQGNVQYFHSGEGLTFVWAISRATQCSMHE